MENFTKQLTERKGTTAVAGIYIFVCGVSVGSAYIIV